MQSGELGLEAGHIHPRSNQQGSRSAGDGREFTEEMELLELEMIAATRFFKAGALLGVRTEANQRAGLGRAQRAMLPPIR